MPTAFANGFTWNYTLNGSNATIGSGSGTDGNATITGAGSGINMSGAIIIPSALNGYPVVGLGLSVFSNCSSITSVKIPNLVTTIADGAFFKCTSLTSINIPDSVTSINGTPFLQNSANLVIIMNTGKFGKTSPSTNQSFFGGTSVDFVLPPTMTITSTTVTTGSTTNNSFIALTFTSTEATTNFVVGDISVTNGSLTNFTAVSGTVYNAIFSPTGQGACTIVVGSGAYTDASGNINSASNTFNWTYVRFPPSMTITSTTTGVISGSTTKNEFIALRFTSTEATTNFVVGDISVTNGALTNFTAVSGTVYNAIFTPATEGACTINVAAGAYTDAVGNNNIASNTFNWTFSTAWGIDASANHLIKSYFRDFVDVSGSIILRENSNLYINGNAETAGNVALNRLFVTADASFNRRIFVGGDVSMNGNVTVSGDLSMNGTVTKCNFNNSSISKSAFSGAVPDGPDYNTSTIVYDQTFQANDDVSMNGPTFAANNVKVSGNIVFGDGTIMNAYDNNISTTNAPAFKASIFSSLDICGNLVAGSYATSSDYRIKTNVVELDETYTVDKLRPVKYFQTQINREKYGLIAHELQEHYPDLVIGEKDGSELQRVNYTGLIAILINEIKRLKQNLAELESKI